MKNLIVHMLYPKRCVLCRQYLDVRTAAVLCDACAVHLRRHYRITDYFRIEGTEGAVAALLYQGAVRTAMQRYKFQQSTVYAEWFAVQLAAAIAVWLEEWRPDCVTYVPMGPARFWERGYNQSELVARKIAKAFALPCEPLLRKQLFVSRQSSRTAEKRKQNVQNAFVLKNHAEIAGRRILLVDDVLTTGATISACAGVLRKAGADRIFAAAITKTP